MNIDALIPPVLQPYKAWIALAFVAITYVIRPSMPAPKATGPTSSWGYVFIFNILDKLAGNFGNAAHTSDNIPAQKQPTPLAAASAPASASAPAQP